MAWGWAGSRGGGKHCKTGAARPAEDPDVINDPRLRQIALNTLFVHPWDHTRLMIALMHLGLKEKVWEEMLGQDFGVSDNWSMGFVYYNIVESLLVNEMLLTSWDGVLRIFPCWPLEKWARFRDLRAKGAFLVSASCRNGKIEHLSVKSERGNPVRMEAPWPETVVREADSGREIATERDGNLLLWETTPHVCYILESGGC